MHKSNWISSTLQSLSLESKTVSACSASRKTASSTLLLLPFLFDAFLFVGCHSALRVHSVLLVHFELKRFIRISCAAVMAPVRRNYFLRGGTEPRWEIKTNAVLPEDMKLGETFLLFTSCPHRKKLSGKRDHKTVFKSTMAYYGISNRQ